MNEVAETIPAKFSVYQSPTSDKYFVKYEGKEEKEITKMEFLQLKADKNRIYENSVKEPIMFEQKDKAPKSKLVGIEKIGDLYAGAHETKEGYARFQHDTCYGIFYETVDSVVIDCIFNSEKGNNAFRRTLWLFENYCKGAKMLVMTNLNQQLIDSLRKSDMPLKATQISKDTIILR